MLPPTPWTLVREEFALYAGVVTTSEGDRLRLVNLSRGTDVFQLDTTREAVRFRFASLSDPMIKVMEARLILYDGEVPVAEHVPSWRDADERTGVLARVETILPVPAAAAAAILLFHLHALPALRLPERSSLLVGTELFSPARAPRSVLLSRWANLPRLLIPHPFEDPAPPLGF